MGSDSDAGAGKWVRITLRLPPDLHAKLVEHAGLVSLNREIVKRLYESFQSRTEQARDRNATLDELQANYERLADEILEAKRSFEADYERLMRMSDGRQASLFDDMGRALGKPGSRKPGGTE
jgi:predicted aminopeptidase